MKIMLCSSSNFNKKLAPQFSNDSSDDFLVMGYVPAWVT